MKKVPKKTASRAAKKTAKPARMTRFGKAAEKILKNLKDDDALIDFYELFLNSVFWLPTTVEKDKRGKETFYPIFGSAKKKEFLVAFESKKLLSDWCRKNAKYLPDKITAAAYDNGHELIRVLAKNPLKKFDLNVAYSKDKAITFGAKMYPWFLKSFEKGAPPKSAKKKTTPSKKAPKK